MNSSVKPYLFSGLRGRGLHNESALKGAGKTKRITTHHVLKMSESMSLRVGRAHTLASSSDSGSLAMFVRGGWKNKVQWLSWCWLVLQTDAEPPPMGV